MSKTTDLRQFCIEILEKPITLHLEKDVFFNLYARLIFVSQCKYFFNEAEHEYKLFEANQSFWRSCIASLFPFVNLPLFRQGASLEIQLK